MEKTLSRRHALTGAVALAAAALPAIAIAAPDADAALFAVFKRWEAGKALELSFGAEHSEMNRRAEANTPPVPAELLQPFQWRGSEVTPRGKRGWTEDDLAHYAPDRKDLFALRAEYSKIVEAAWAEASAGEDTFNEIVSANTALIIELGETPANTLQGLLAKCHVAQTECLFIHFMDFSDYAQGLVEDIQRLAAARASI